MPLDPSNRIYTTWQLEFTCLCVAGTNHKQLLGNPKDVDDEGLLMDVDVQPIEDVPSHEDKRRDVDHFFQSPVEKTINGKSTSVFRTQQDTLKSSEFTQRT